METPSDAEIQFSKARRKIQFQVNACFRTAEICLGIRPAGSGCSFDSLIGDIQPDTLEGQEMLLSTEYRREGGTEKVEVAIGHNAKWEPVITVTSAKGNPQSFVFQSGLDQTPIMFAAIVKGIKGE